MESLSLIVHHLINPKIQLWTRMKIFSTTLINSLAESSDTENTAPLRPLHTGGTLSPDGPGTKPPGDKGSAVQSRRGRAAVKGTEARSTSTLHVLSH